MKRNMTIRSATLEDSSQVRDIAIATGLFDADSWPEIATVMTESVEAAETDHVWIVLETGGAVIGAAYYAPEPFAHRMWNMYFLGVLPGHQGSGAGRALVAHVEQALRERGERVLIIETSGLESFEATRTFYARNGYDEEARIRDFYGPGDNKVVFWKSLQTTGEVSAP